MELIKLLSVFVALGALCVLGWSIIATDSKFGVTSQVGDDISWTPAIVFLIAVVVNIVVGKLQKPKDF